MEASAVTGVTGIVGAAGTAAVSHCERPVTKIGSPVASGISAGGFTKSFSTLCGFNGNNPPLLHPARMFFFVNADTLAEL